MIGNQSSWWAESSEQKWFLSTASCDLLRARGRFLPSGCRPLRADIMWPTATAVGGIHPTTFLEPRQGRHRHTASVGSESAQVLCRPLRGLAKCDGTRPHGSRRGLKYAARYAGCCGSAYCLLPTGLLRLPGLTAGMPDLQRGHSAGL